MRAGKLAERKQFAADIAVRDAERAAREPIKRIYRPTTARHMKLSKAGEIRALLRLGAGGELAPRIKEAAMATEALDEVIEPTVKLDMTDTHITLDQRTAQALYSLALEQFEEALLKMNAAYNQTEWSSAHDRAKTLLWDAQDLRQAIEVIYQLTPMPDEAIEDE